MKRQEFSMKRKNPKNKSILIDNIINIENADFCNAVTLANQIVTKFYEIGICQEVGINALSIALLSGLIQYGCTRNERSDFFKEFCTTIIHPGDNPK